MAGDFEVEAAIDDIRAFNRFHTRFLGALKEGLLDSPHSLAEGRVIYEIGSRGETMASALADDLGLDPAYLSRILRKLRDGGLVTAARSDADGRVQVLRMTEAGRKEFEALDRASHDEIAALIAPMRPQEIAELRRAMRRIAEILRRETPRATSTLIRSHRPGDIGWIVSRHGVLYSEEYGWDETFEGLVAEIAGDFLKSYDPKREHCWVAERDGAIVGSVFLVDAGDGVGKLRLLYVEPTARGAGIGARLVAECMRFARQAGYRRMTLWTNDVLVSARRIYEAAGFRLVSEERHHSFGKDLVGQYWETEL